MGSLYGWYVEVVKATSRTPQDIKDHYPRGDDLMIVSPDIGGVVRARSLASRLDADLAIVDKRRARAGESEVMNIIGDVKGRRCILFDDIVDSGGTLVNAAKAIYTLMDQKGWDAELAARALDYLQRAQRKDRKSPKVASARHLYVTVAKKYGITTDNA